MSTNPPTPKLLGKGTFGIVFEGTWQGEKVAIKRIDKTEFLVQNATSDSTSSGRRGEEEIMKKLDHPNVLKLLHVQSDDSFKYFYLELCEATVGDYCKGKYDGPLPSPEALSLHQMASGLAFIHGERLVHRDIKEENVLIYKSPTTGVTCLKISDFGLCKPISASGSFSMRSGVKGTRNFFSPELLELADQQANDASSLNLKRINISSDIFALGCVFYSFLTKGKHPFAHPKGTFFIPINVLSGIFDLTPLLDIFYHPIIEGMIAADPNERLGLDIVKEMLKSRLS